MATSGSTDFTLNRNQIIRQAYEIIGVAVDGEALNGDDIDVAQRALNVMIKAWMAHGLNLWLRDTQSIPLVQGQASYTLGPTGDVVMVRPKRILEMNRKTTSDGHEINMVPLSRNEYEFLPNKSTQGTPVQYNYNPTLTNGTLYVWPTATATEATNLTLEIVYETEVEDLDSSLDNVDFPPEWIEAIIYNLAVRLAPINSLDIKERSFLRAEAKEMLDLVLNFDTENESMFIQPNYRSNF